MQPLYEKGVQAVNIRFYDGNTSEILFDEELRKFDYFIPVDMRYTLCW